MESIKNWFRIDRLKSWWHNKTPRQKWQTIHDLGANLSKLLGLNIYGDLKDFWYNYTIHVLVAYYVFTVSYTIWYYFDEGNPMIGLQCTCTLGVVVTVSLTSLNTFHIV